MAIKPVIAEGGVVSVGVVGVDVGVDVDDSVAAGVGVMDAAGSEVSGVVGEVVGGVEVQPINTTRITSNEIIRLHFIPASQRWFGIFTGTDNQARLLCARKPLIAS